MPQGKIEESPIANIDSMLQSSLGGWAKSFEDSSVGRAED
jgi:hypothetical protein